MRLRSLVIVIMLLFLLLTLRFTCGSVLDKFKNYLNYETYENKTEVQATSIDNGISQAARKSKKKTSYTFSLILAALLMKVILLPLAFKAMAVMSTIAVMMSTLSLIISSIIGYAKLAWQHVHPGALRVVHLGKGNAWAKDDDLIKNYPFAEVIHYNEGEEEDIGVTPLHHVHYYHK